MKNEAKYKEYHILIEDNNSVKILSSEEPLTPVEPKLREIAEEINFDVEESWNTQTLGSKLVDHLHKMSECQKNQGKAIVINRMYVGDYLSSNLGHEVINMYTADNGEHYLYLNAYGNFSKEHTDKVGYMLLVKYHAEGVLEVIGKAEGLTDVPGTNNPLPKNYQENIPGISATQKEYIKKITYGKVPLLEIFHGAEQQNIFVTYKANRLYIPKRQLFISYGNIEGVKSDVVLCGYKQANTSLKTYIYKEGTFKGDQTKPDEATKEFRRQDYKNLIKLIYQEGLWQSYDKKINREDITEETHEISIFDICQIQNKENCFSNALEYFARKYPQLWGEFFKFGQCRSYSNLSSVEYIGIDLKLPFSVVREQDTKIKDSNSGRIDLFVSNEEHYIVLENKIKSDINKVDSDSDDCTQLNRYVKYVEHKNECSEKKKTPHYFILTPNYNIPKIIEEKMKEKYKIITYKDLYEFLKNRDEVKKDINFKAFFNAIKRHTRDNVNDYLYYEMQEKLMHRIYEYHKRTLQL